MTRGLDRAAIGSALRLILAPGTVFLVAAVAVVLSGRWRPLFAQLLAAQWLLVGLAGGALVFVLSMLVVGGWRSMPSLRDLNWRRTPRPGALWRVIELGARALYEEAFWRGTVQFLLVGLLPPSGAAIAIVGVAALFAARHLYLESVSGRSVHLRQIVEFLLFGIVLGAVYHHWEQLLLVVGIHWGRNLFIELMSASGPDRNQRLR